MTTPKAIQSFIAATNAGDTQAFLASFSEDAFLSDWGRDFRGRAEIARWNGSDNIGVKSQMRLVRLDGTGPDYTARIAVSGNGYNGEGTMAIKVDGDHITRLVIS